MKKILFPTDFSATAENAFIYALRLANLTGASITTVHCFEMPDLRRVHLPVTVQEVYESINLEEFQNYKDNIPRLQQVTEQQGLTSVKVSHVLEEGRTVPTIIRMAKKEAADLIVMGTTGASGLKEIFLGSVAAEVMENAPCPVLAVPGEAKFDGRFDRFAFLTEFKSEEEKALRWLVDWVAPFQADIYCLHVDVSHTAPLTHRMENLKVDFLDKPHVKFEVVDDTDLEKAVAQFMADNRIDILAMVIHQRNFLQELFTQSTTKKMAYHLKNPVLAVQANLFAEGRMKFNPPVLST